MTSSLRNSTLCFLIKKSTNTNEACLALKKRGFGVGRWNGVGGKVELGESIEDAVKREAFEEIGVRVIEIKKFAELTFLFPDNPGWNQLVHVYICSKWEDEPVESEEMKPEWYEVSKIPYKEMWVDDELWLPKVLEGKEITGTFCFGPNDVLLEHCIVEVLEL